MNVESLLLGTVLAMVAGAVGIGAWLLYWQLRHTPPSAYAQMETTIADMNRQLSDMREQQASDHMEMRRLRAEVTRLDAEMQEWRAAYARLVREFLGATGREPETKPPADVPPAPKVTVNRPAAGFARKLIEAFSADELSGLAFELGIDGELTGDSVSERARSLVSVAGRRGQMADLLEVVRRERPEGGF